jgi:hypothetical protein
MYKILHVLVEGDDDESFVDNVIKAWLVTNDRYNDVIPFQYARKKKEVIENYVNTVNYKGEDLICLTDSIHAPCITGRLEQLINYEIGTFDPAMIFVVVKVIEGWYLAGIDNGCCRRIRIEYVPRTDQIKKEDFHEIIAKSKYRPRAACKYEMLRNFDVQLASERNRSFFRIFDRFLNKN